MEKLTIRKMSRRRIDGAAQEKIEQTLSFSRSLSHVQPWTMAADRLTAP
jgi:hypothetical protein